VRIQSHRPFLLPSSHPIRDGHATAVDRSVIMRERAYRALDDGIGACFLAETATSAPSSNNARGRGQFGSTNGLTLLCQPLAASRSSPITVEERPGEAGVGAIARFASSSGRHKEPIQRRTTILLRGLRAACLLARSVCLLSRGTAFGRCNALGRMYFHGIRFFFF